MAQRRMFNRAVVEGDAFLSLPPRAQCLYFHACMYADDDGVVDNLLGVVRGIRAGKASVKLLLEHGLLLQLQPDVYVVTHWQVHNYIRNDRYVPGMYTNIVQTQLNLRQNIYTFVENLEEKWPSDAENCDTHVRHNDNHLVDTGKDRKEKCRVDKDRLTPSPLLRQSLDAYHTLCPNLPPVVLPTDEHEQLVQNLAPLIENQWELLFAKVANTPFLNGDNDRGWSSDFAWICKLEHAGKIVNGQYDMAGKGKKGVKTNDKEEGYEFHY